MITILSWAVFGLVVGGLAKLFHPGEEPIGCLPTIGLGVAGSYLGGAINWLITGGHSPMISASGVFMSIFGAFLLCMAWSWYKSRK